MNDWLDNFMVDHPWWFIWTSSGVGCTLAAGLTYAVLMEWI